MNADEALQEWGRRKLLERYPGTEYSEVYVDQEIDPGYNCCGGSDPECYCSYAESPSMKIEIVGYIGEKRKSVWRETHRIELDDYNYDFARLIREIVAVGEEIDAELMKNGLIMPEDIK